VCRIRAAIVVPPVQPLDPLIFTFSVPPHLMTIFLVSCAGLIRLNSFWVFCVDPEYDFGFPTFPVCLVWGDLVGYWPSDFFGSGFFFVWLLLVSCSLGFV